MAKVIPAGTMVQLWIGLPSVKAKVTGISLHGQYTLLHTWNEVNHLTGEMEEVHQVFYRDRWFIETMQAGVS